jgi:hypothetical protein
LDKFHIQAKKVWEPFSINGVEYDLAHLTAHEVTYKGKNDNYTFVVTYGLHCFTKDDVEHSILETYTDGREARQINLERYEASKRLRAIVEDFASKKFYQTTTEKFFTFEALNTLSNTVEQYKICFCIFKENRLSRLHITTAFFDNRPVQQTQQYSIFKIAMDARKRPKNRTLPIEARGKN